MNPKLHLALLRGINVGGKNVIKMADLRASFVDLGFADVSTYIQSGNVIFSASTSSVAKLEQAIEKGLSERFSYESRVVVVPLSQLKKILNEAPRGFGSSPDKYRYDVIFLKKPLTPSKALKVAETRPGVDTVAAGKQAIYFSRLISKATQSRLPKIVQKPEYQFMTIRNWNTSTKLLQLLESAGTS